MTRIILASQSPRRRELLTQMGLEFEAVPSQFNEHLDDARTPDEVAIELAIGKAQAVAAQYPDAIVIGSDTIVTLNGRQLEKPRDADEAHATLKSLAGHSNQVTTGVAIVHQAVGLLLSGADTTDVQFRPYDEAAVTRYVASGDPLDKAGSFSIQSGGAPLISHIVGEYDTVIGLPTKLLSHLLHQAGIETHPVELEAPVPQHTQ